MQITKIYIGCSLTHAPAEFKTAVEAVKADLANDYEILEFLGLEKGAPADVYHWDIHQCVAGCDLFVALCDYPAIGLGYELGVAVEQLRKPVLALARQDAHVTRLVQGITAPHYTFERYDSLEEIPKLIRQKISELNHAKDTQ